MKNKLKIIFTIFTIFLSSCGYTPIYKNPNSEKLIISNKVFSGNKIINKKIFNRLNLKEENVNSGFELKLNSNLQISELAKDKSGNVTTYKTTITVYLVLIKEQEVFKERNFEKSFSYANLNNKFELSKYQKEVENNLITTIAQGIKIFLDY
tara:strand:+ start:336 stop:791 length:456 start_codon:yes stop_codon:yes gene_type:complete